MTDNEKLNPCPKCGAKSECGFSSVTSWHSITCTECTYTSAFYSSKKHLVEDWNSPPYVKKNETT